MASDLHPTAPRWQEVRAAFLEAQTGQCAICRDVVPAEKAKLDHCHRSGFIRGVLCNSCNTKLGWYEKRRRKIEVYLARAAEYIARPGQRGGGPVTAVVVA